MIYKGTNLWLVEIKLKAKFVKPLNKKPNSGNRQEVKSHYKTTNSIHI
jgi:hypothetical protein